MPGLLHDPIFPPLSWWIEHRRDDPQEDPGSYLGAFGRWIVYEADTENRVSFEVADTPYRRDALDLIQAFLDIIAKRRDAPDLAPSTIRTEDP